MRKKSEAPAARSSEAIQHDIRLMERWGWLRRVLYINRLAPRTGSIVRNKHYGESEPAKQSLDLILPRCGSAWPVLIFIHGGGFSSQDKLGYQRLAKTFAHQGYLVCNIDYRLAPRWKYPVQLDDVAEAVRWCWEHVREYGGDRERLFLAGDSAGAYLAAIYAAAMGDDRLLREIADSSQYPIPSLRGLLLFYGIYDLETVTDTAFPLVGKMARDILGTDPEEYRHRAHLASPVRHIGPHFPATFLVSTDLDPLHSQSLQMAEALTAAGIFHRTLFLKGREYPNAYHGFLTYWTRKASRLALNEALQFMHQLT